MSVVVSHHGTKVRESLRCDRVLDNIVQKATQGNCTRVVHSMKVYRALASVGHIAVEQQSNMKHSISIAYYTDIVLI